MKKIIWDADSNIKIEVTTADEMYGVFYIMNGWKNLQVDDDYYPMRCEENHWMSYTRDYFKKKYFDNS